MTEAGRRDRARLNFLEIPRNRSRLTIGGPDGIVIVSPAVPPNRFWRTMQRWCLGLVWEELEDPNFQFGSGDE